MTRQYDYMNKCFGDATNSADFVFFINFTTEFTIRKLKS